MATIYTLPPIADTPTSIIVLFNVTDDGYAGGEEIWTANVGYKLHSSSEWIWLGDIAGFGEGTFQQNISGLTENTPYDVITMITNSAGTAYSDIVSFQTEFNMELPTVSTMPAKNITHSSSQLELILTDDGNSTDSTQAYTRFTYWKTGGQQKTTDWLSVTEGEKSTVTITGLDPNTVYFFYAQARNSEGQVNGDTLSFKTYPNLNISPVSFDPNEPNTLLIQNFIKVFQNDVNKPYDNQGLFTYVEGIGLDGLDSNDVLYTMPDSVKTSKIISLITQQKLQGQTAGFYELSKDARPDNAKVCMLELGISSIEEEVPDVNSENSLEFWLANNAFKGKTITIQKVSSDPNIIYPVWDVNMIISKNDRIMPLDNLVNQKTNVPYAWFVLSTSRQILDLNEDGIVDLADYDFLHADFGKTGIYRSDIACTKGNVSAIGIPDGKVDATDEIAFITEYNKNNPANPIPNPYKALIEDFESGQIQEPFTTSGDSPWTISVDFYGGNYCARSGNIESNQSSVLQATAMVPTGNISFRVKASSESEFDKLTFYIDGAEKGRWSGELNWEEVTYQVAPGTHTFEWEYKKDASVSGGEDAAWIDDVNIY